MFYLYFALLYHSGSSNSVNHISHTLLYNPMACTNEPYNLTFHYITLYHS